MTEQSPADQEPVNRNMFIGWVLLSVLVIFTIATWKVLLHVA